MPRRMAHTTYGRISCVQATQEARKGRSGCARGRRENTGNGDGKGRCAAGPASGTNILRTPAAAPTIISCGAAGATALNTCSSPRNPHTHTDKHTQTNTRACSGSRNPETQPGGTMHAKQQQAQQRTTPAYRRVRAEGHGTGKGARRRTVRTRARGPALQSTSGRNRHAPAWAPCP
jgi:hypothetical protein